MCEVVCWVFRNGMEKQWMITNWQYELDGLTLIFITFHYKIRKGHTMAMTETKEPFIELQVSDRRKSFSDHLHNFHIVWSLSFRLNIISTRPNMKLPLFWIICNLLWWAVQMEESMSKRYCEVERVGEAIQKRQIIELDEGIVSEDPTLCLYQVLHSLMLTEFTCFLFAFPWSASSLMITCSTLFVTT